LGGAVRKFYSSARIPSIELDQLRQEALTAMALKEDAPNGATSDSGKFAWSVQ
jgi:hypothetical protein